MATEQYDDWWIVVNENNPIESRLYHLHSRVREGGSAIWIKHRKCRYCGEVAPAGLLFRLKTVRMGFADGH